MPDNDAAILDRLNGHFRRVAELVGVENALKLAQEFGGQWISVPKLDDMRREVRDAAIREEYDRARDKTGAVRRLSKQHNLTTRHIYNILGKEPTEAPVVLPLFFTETPLAKPE
jgi:Mor family transcriptional regulator